MSSAGELIQVCSLSGVEANGLLLPIAD